MVNTMLEAQRTVYPTAKAQEILAQQQIAAQYGMQSLGMMQDFQQNQAILVNQTNPNKIADEIILSLKGQKRNADGTLTQIYAALMNEIGIGRVEFLLRPIVNQGTVLSHTEKEEIGRLLNHIADSFTDELAINWKEYGVTDKSYLDSVIDCFTIPAFFALKRSEGQNEKNWLGRISVENINNAPRIQAPKKESWLSKFKL